MPINYRNAKTIKKALDNYVMGQEKGTKAIAMAIAMHLAQIDARMQYPRAHYPKDNVLLIGPTGCGKTETFRTLNKLEEDFGCPIVMFNAMDYSGTGSWRNSQKLSKIFEEVAIHASAIYCKKYSHDVDTKTLEKEVAKIANNAIILLDEADKLACQYDDNNGDMLHEYQTVLLKMIEGNTYEVKGLSHSVEKTNIFNEFYDEEEDVTITVDTTNMMFILLGAFEGLEDITRMRLLIEAENNKPEWMPYQDSSIGFYAGTSKPSVPDKPPESKEFTYEQLIPSTEDLVEYGFLRELVGRIPVRTIYKPLSEDNLVDILLHCKTSTYRAFQRRFRLYGHELRCDRDALREIAKIAVSKGTGARGLHNIFADLLSDTQYELSGNPFHIHCLLRGKEIRAGKPPLLHDRTDHDERRAGNWLKCIRKRIKLDKDK